MKPVPSERLPGGQQAKPAFRLVCGVPRACSGLPRSESLSWGWSLRRDAAAGRRGPWPADCS